MNSSATCLMILSTKGAGSSALLKFILAHSQYRTIEWTRHYERETLYWTKAASILELPQVELTDSEVPIPAARAREELRTFLQRNLGEEPTFDSDEQMIFEGWRRLCHRFGPAFVEKTPHQLHQWSAMGLLRRAINQFPEIEHRAIALIRNPVDAIYSQWARWRALPEVTQFEWMTAYQNMIRAREMLRDKMLEVRYEDLATDELLVDRLGDFIGCRFKNAKTVLDAQSIARWKADRRFGMSLDPRVREFAMRFGYATEELDTTRRMLWPAYRLIERHGYRNPESILSRIYRRLRSFASRVRRFSSPE
jgi:hypothetical protein